MEGGGAWETRTWKRPAVSVRAISEPAATMATGPDSWPATLEKLVTMLIRPPVTNPPNLRGREEVKSRAC